MRIRKHAARILSSLSIPTQSFAVTEAAAAEGRQLETHVCQLNQSPWDAMAFTPPGDVPLYHYQEMDDVEEENGFVLGAWRSGQREEELAATAVSDVRGTTASRSTRRLQVKVEEMAEGAQDEEKWERKIEAKKRSTNRNTKMIKRKSATGNTQDKIAKMEVESAATVVTSTCKKSDGKGWHCKREARRPHSLCEYHLTQVQSYYTNAGSNTQVLPPPLPKMQGGDIVDAKQNDVWIPDKKNVKNTKSKRKDNGSDVDAAGRKRRQSSAPSDFYYYYYSGFGPSWRKRRSSGGGGNGGDREARNVDASNGDDEGDGAGDDAPPLRVHDQAPDDLDDDDDLDDLGECDEDDVVASKRRGRKPIKARSLKSLL